MKRIKWEQGFSLSQVAAEYCGSEEYFKYIVKLNKLDILNKEINVGQILDIPELNDIKKLFPAFDKLKQLINEKSLIDIAKKKVFSTIGVAADGISPKIIDFINSLD